MSDHDSLVKYEPNWVETVTERCGQAATRLDAENTEAANIYSVVIRKAGRLPKNQQIKMISSRRKNRTITMSPDAKDFLQSQPVNTSAIVATAIIRVYEDNSLLLKALKRRLALGQEKATEMVRTSISLEESVLEMLQKLSLGSQLSLEEVLRLIIETYIHKI